MEEIKEKLMLARAYLSTYKRLKFGKEVEGVSIWGISPVVGATLRD